MKFIKYIGVLVFVMALVNITNAQTKKAMKGTYALTNATIETVTNGTIENGTVLIQNGKINSTNKT